MGARRRVRLRLGLLRRLRGRLRRRPLDEVRREVAAAKDRLGMSVDKGIRNLVVGLRAWGVDTDASCEGHRNHGAPFPWVDVPRRHTRRLLLLVSLWNSVAPADERRGKAKWREREWVILPISSLIRLVPGDRGRPLKEMQRRAGGFGCFLQDIEEISRDGLIYATRHSNL